jgi:hypothetical protein
VTALLQSLGPTGATVAVLFGLIFGLASALERYSSPEAKKALSEYLRTADFSSLAVHLPEGTKEAFEKVFGKRSLSWRCARRSIFFSIATILILLFLGFINHFDYFQTMPTWLVERPSHMIFFFGYILWSLIPDFLNLLKTRAIISYASRNCLYLGSFISVALFDLLVSLVLFLVYIDIAQWVTIAFQLSYELGVLKFVAALRDIYPMFVRQLPDHIFHEFPRLLSGPISNEDSVFFSAGLLPSAWLWLYIAATALARTLTASSGVIELVIFSLDTKRHPIRSIGIVAAAISCATYLVVHWIF